MLNALHAVYGMCVGVGDDHVCATHAGEIALAVASNAIRHRHIVHELDLSESSIADGYVCTPCVHTELAAC